MSTTGTISAGRTRWATPAQRERQRGYAAVRGERRVYTPQIIVNGSKISSAATASIEQRRSASPACRSPVTIELRRRHGRDRSVGRRSRCGMSAARRFGSSLMTSRGGGDDRARRERRARPSPTTTSCATCAPIGMWNGEPLTITLPADEAAWPTAWTRCAILVQEDLQERTGRDPRRRLDCRQRLSPAG